VAVPFFVRRQPDRTSISVTDIAARWNIPASFSQEYLKRPSLVPTQRKLGDVAIGFLD